MPPVTARAWACTALAVMFLVPIFTACPALTNNATGTTQVGTSTAAPAHFAVRIGDRYTWTHQDGSKWEYHINHLGVDVPSNMETVNSSTSSSSGFFENQRVATWWNDSYYSYDGYLWPVPIDLPKINESAYARLYAGDTIIFDGKTIRVTDSTDPGYTCNYTFNDLGVVTRREEIDGARDHWWYDLTYSKHSNALVAGITTVSAPAMGDGTIKLNITTRDAVNLTITATSNAPTPVALENGTLYIQIDCSMTGAVAFPATLVVDYDPELVEAAGLIEADLQLVYFNQLLQRWESIPSTLDAGNDRLVARLDHFSDFAITTGDFPPESPGAIPGPGPVLLGITIAGAAAAAIIAKRRTLARRHDAPFLP